VLVARRSRRPGPRFPPSGGAGCFAPKALGTGWNHGRLRFGGVVSRNELVTIPTVGAPHFGSRRRHAHLADATRACCTLIRRVIYAIRRRVDPVGAIVPQPPWKAPAGSSSDGHDSVATLRLGHSTISITLDLYSNVLPGMQSEAAEQVSNMIFGGGA